MFQKKVRTIICYTPSLDLDIPDLNMTLMMRGKGKKRVALRALFFTQIDRHSAQVLAYVARVLARVTLMLARGSR